MLKRHCRRGTRFSDVETAPAAVAKSEDLVFEERVKRELHPLDAYTQIVENAIGNKAPDKEDTFRFKWNGLFYLTPNKGGVHGPAADSRRAVKDISAS